MPLSTSKKPKFGTVSVIAVFLGTLILIGGLTVWLLSKVFRKTPENAHGFGFELLLAAIIVPLVIFIAIIGLVSALIFARSFRQETMPDNHSAGLIIRGLFLAIPSWTMGFFAWSSQNRPLLQRSKVPLIVATLSQIALIVMLGSVGRLSDTSRRRVWGTVLCLAVVAPPLLLLNHSF